LSSHEEILDVEIVAYFSRSEIFVNGRESYPISSFSVFHRWAIDKGKFW
jgi:hypothetical protein